MSTDPLSDHIETWDGPEFNARWYRHAGCARWLEPADDSQPAAETECADCAAWLPVVRVPMPGAAS